MRIFKKPISKSLLLTALIAAAVTVGTGVANAALVTDTQTFSFDGSYVQSSPYSLSLNSFNPALGTLTDISLTVVTNLTPEVQILNLTSSTVSFSDAQSSGTFNLNGPGSTVVTASASTGPMSGTAPGPQFTISTFAGTIATQTQTIDLASTIWAQYLSTSPLSFQAFFGPFTSSSPDGVYAVGGDALVNGNVTIDYTYTEVSSTPLPATLLLLGPGLVGLASIRRRFGK